MTKPKPIVGIWQNGEVRVLRQIGRPGALLFKLFFPIQSWWWRTRYGIGTTRRGSAKIEGGYFEGKRERETATLVDQLEQLGFYNYTDPQYLEEAKADGSGFYGFYRDFSQETGKQFDIHEVTKRAYLADSEDLAEGGVLKFLSEVEPFLDTQDVQISSRSDDFNIGGGYSVNVNGVEYAMYSAEELAEDEMRRSKVPGGIWYYATYRSFAMINHLLEGAGSDERIYLIGGGNDGSAVFLTPEMYRLIGENTAILDRDKPKAVDEESR